MDDEIPRCGSLQHVSYSNFVLSILIALGIVVSYLPQHYRIVHKKSVEGISPYFLLLGLISSTCALWNILLLQRSVVGCCASLTLLQCFAAVLGILQIVLQFAMFAVVFILYLIYLPRLHTSAVYMTAIYLAFFVASASLTIFFGRSRQLYQVRFAYVLGLVGAGLAILQYFPQLYTTWAFSHVGSLSIPMMCLQTPGSILFAFTLAMRKGTNWSTWGVYAVTAVLQGTLLAMCITFEYRDRQKGKAATDRGEREPLLE